MNCELGHQIETNQKKVAFCHVQLMNIRNFSTTLQSMREQIKMKIIC